MLIFGHAVQVTHLALIALAIFFGCAKAWALPMLIVAVCLSWGSWNGECIITDFANKLFNRGGSIGHTSLFAWLASLTGR